MLASVSVRHACRRAHRGFRLTLRSAQSARALSMHGWLRGLAGADVPHMCVSCSVCGIRRDLSQATPQLRGLRVLLHAHRRQTCCR